jgi:hypothetical protein
MSHIELEPGLPVQSKNVIHATELFGKKRPSSKPPLSEIDQLKAEQRECRQKASECAEKADALDLAIINLVDHLPPLVSQERPEEERLLPDFLGALVDGLPFVRPLAPDGRSPTLERRDYWTDQPSDDGATDFQRGKRYARMTTAAMRSLVDASAGHVFARTISVRCLECIFESMIRDGIARRVKGGVGSRSTLTPAMSGFLSELAREMARVAIVK